jgi:hypothetical protein
MYFRQQEASRVIFQITYTGAQRSFAQRKDILTAGKSLLPGEEVNWSETHEKSFQERLALTRKIGLSCLSKRSPAEKEEVPDRMTIPG